MKYVRSVQEVLNVTKGCIGRGLSFFYRAFGRTEKEFFDILLMPDAMILYRFFFEWLESKGHKLSKYRWERIIDGLSEAEKAHFIEFLNSEDDEAPQLAYIEELKPFYVNLRDQIVNPNGSLYELKPAFDSLSKQEKEDILEQYR